MIRMAVFMSFLVLGVALAFPSYAAGPLKVCLLSGSFEYDSHTSLTAFKVYLEENYNAKATLLEAKEPKGADLPGLEALEDCDVALFFTRRQSLEGEQLRRIKDYCEAGKPIVAVRTASHGIQTWLEFDKEVLGGNYNGHFGNGPTIEVNVKPSAKGHPTLEGVGPLKSRYSLYRTKPIAEDAELLMVGKTPESRGVQPVTWTRMHNGGRVFYTSLGGPGDFEGESFRRMIANALFWTAQRTVERKPLPDVPRRAKPEGTMTLTVRTRGETEQGSSVWEEKTATKEIPVAETAIILCDMWDKHWCSFASERVDKMAVEMNTVVCAARDAGVQIIHAPSDTLGFYQDTVQRRRMQSAPSVEAPAGIEVNEPPLPIDDSDGGCPEDDKAYSAWTRQHPAILITEPDGISDNGREVYNFLHQEGIKHVIMMGVHTNMCVLGRSFAIRQMTRWGLNCYLVRDLTDTMYNPAKPPKVSHDEGTELVVQHIEKYWCPSMLSADLAAGLPK